MLIEHSVGVSSILVGCCLQLKRAIYNCHFEALTHFRLLPL